MSCRKVKSKQIKDLDINLFTLNQIEEKVGSSLKQIDTGNHFLNITLVPQTLRATINMWDFLKLKIFSKAKDMANKTEQHPTE